MTETERRAEPRRVVVSPHLDDAVFGCGQWLAAHPGSTVVTVFAGTPRPAERRTDWDAQCGFRSAGEAMAARRCEDRRALSHVHATPLWLDFCDGQYESPSTPQQLADGLAEVFRTTAPSELLLPLGLFHPDHLRVHEAAALALRGLPGTAVLGYEDALYRAMPGLLQQRLAALRTAGVGVTPANFDVEAGMLLKKRMAVDAYASQLRVFARLGLDDLWQPERFWKLEGGAFPHVANVVTRIVR